MNLFNVLGGSKGNWLTNTAKQAFDRIAGVETRRTAAKSETRRLQKELAQVRSELQRSRTVRPAAPQIERVSVDAKLAGRSFATKKGMRRVPYAYEGRFLELELDLSKMEKDIADDLKSLREAVDQARKEETDKLRGVVEALEGRIKVMEEAAEKSAQAQEETLAQVSKELGDLRTYAQALDAEKSQRQEQMAILRGPMLGVLQNAVTALNATEAPSNPLGVWLSEGLDAYTRVGADVPEDMRQWLEIASLLSRVWAYYDSSVGLESIISAPRIGSNVTNLDASKLLEQVQRLASQQAELQEELRRRLPANP